MAGLHTQCLQRHKALSCSMCSEPIILYQRCWKNAGKWKPEAPQFKLLKFRLETRPPTPLPWRARNTQLSKTASPQLCVTRHLSIALNKLQRLAFDCVVLAADRPVTLSASFKFRSNVQVTTTCGVLFQLCAGPQLGSGGNVLYARLQVTSGPPDSTVVHPVDCFPDTFPPMKGS